MRASADTETTRYSAPAAGSTVAPSMVKIALDVNDVCREMELDVRSTLLDALRERPPRERPLYIVLPDHQRPACRALYEALRPHGFIVRTAAQIKSEVGKAIRGNR